MYMFDKNSSFILIVLMYYTNIVFIKYINKELNIKFNLKKICVNKFKRLL